MQSQSEELLEQANGLAARLQRERRDLAERNRSGERASLRVLEQQLAQLWNAIRTARSDGGANTEVGSRSSKWS